MVWELTYPKRPWTTNRERNWHFHARAKVVKEWRDAFKDLSYAAGIPPLLSMRIEATPHAPTRRTMDIGNCYPAVKAAIDGIVDAGVIPDDSLPWLTGLEFFPDEYHKGEPALVIRVIGEPA